MGKRGYKPETARDKLDRLSMPEPNSGCWLWLGRINQDGYGHISVRRSRWDRAHRIAWAEARGPIPTGLFVCHKCDVRSCVNPDHLFLGTNQDNVDDMIAKGRKAPTPSHCLFPNKPHKQHSKLTEEQILAIRSDPRGASVIAAEYGIVQQHVSKIRLLQRWGHL